MPGNHRQTLYVNVGPKDEGGAVKSYLDKAIIIEGACGEGAGYREEMWVPPGWRGFNLWVVLQQGPACQAPIPYSPGSDVSFIRPLSQLSQGSPKCLVWRWKQQEIKLDLGKEDKGSTLKWPGHFWLVSEKQA